MSDVDGTLTTGELEDVLKRPLGKQPDIRPDAVEALSLLARKGYRPFYLTARPERVTVRTRELLISAGFPDGVIRTAESGLGVFGSRAVEYKTGQITALESAGFVVDVVERYGTFVFQPRFNAYAAYIARKPK